MMNYAFEMMDFVVKMMNFVLLTWMDVKLKPGRFTAPKNDE